MRTVDRIGRVRAAALGLALVWAALLPLCGLTLPLYSTSVTTQAGTTSGTDTLVGVNGNGALVVLLVPLLMSVLVAAFLVARTPATLVVAWVLTAALLGVTALALLTVGILVLPVPVALVVACAAGTAQPQPKYSNSETTIPSGPRT